MEYRQRIVIPAAEADEMQRLLDLPADGLLRDHGVDEDATLKTYTAVFPEGMEVDIKVCSGQSNCFVDPVLFENGNEVLAAEPCFDLLGEYAFPYMQDVYVVTLVREDDPT